MDQTDGSKNQEITARDVLPPMAGGGIQGRCM